MANRDNRVKAILRELDLSIGSEMENRATLDKFIRDHGYHGSNNINFIKNWYEEFKANYKKEVLKHFRVELTHGDDLDSKLNELLREQHLEWSQGTSSSQASEIQDPTLGWLMKWFERNKAEEDLERLRREQSFDDEWNNLMNISTPDIRLQTSHKERHKKYVEGATRNLLHGDIDPEVSKEGTKFIQSHKLHDLYNDDECILLFEPADETKFRECLHKASYKADQVVVKSYNLYTNYYLNKLSSINAVLELLDRIIQECAAPFKIMCDCGFIVEDTSDNIYTNMPPNENEVE